MMNTFKTRNDLYMTIDRNLLTPLLLSGLFVILTMTVPHKTFGFETKKHSTVDQAEHANRTDSRWSYHGFQGPRFWGFLEKANKECRIGHQQSPIDVVMPDSPDYQESLDIEYSKMPFEAISTTHGIQFRTPGKSRLLFNGNSYWLKQFHFHDPSEHHIDGKEFPLEMHLVHESHEGRLLVVALLFKQGSVNAGLADILQLSAKLQDSRPIFNVKNNNTGLRSPALNLKHLLPDNLHHFSYQGSLTTPPCTEGVQWIIFRAPLQLSATQLDTFKTLYGVNARPVQPLYDRAIQDN